MPVNNNNFEIENVELADTFEFWRTKTNDAIIAKLNYLKLYDLGISSATGGGITATVATSLGKLNIELNDIISKGVTFLNVDVGFSGGVFINNSILNLNRDDEGSILMGSTCGIVLGPATGGYTADGGWLESGNSFSINGFTGPYWLNNNGYWFTEQDLRLDRQEGTRLQFGSSGSNNNLVFCGPGQGYTTDPGMTAMATGGINTNSIRIYNMAERGINDLAVAGGGGGRYNGTNRNQVAEILDDGTVHFTSGVNKKRVEQVGHGFTFGNLIRLDRTNYVKSCAGATNGDGTTYDAKFSEVVGMVSNILGATHGGREYGNTFDITFSGEVRGDFSTVAGAALDPGCLYYMSVSEEGAITKSQPTGTGLTYDMVVSKPVLYALGETAGLLLPYRGQKIVPDSATIARYGASGGALGTADIYHTSRISITNVHGFTAGEVVAFHIGFKDAAGNAIAAGYTHANRLNDLEDSTKATDTARSVVGIVGLRNTSANTCTIITSGLISNNDDIFFETTGPNVLGTTYGGLSADNTHFDEAGGWYKPICTVLDARNAVVHVGGVQPVRASEYAGGAAARSNWGGGGNTTKTLINGSFYYWRRGIGTDSVSAYGPTGDTYFADRWKRTSGASATAVGATHDFSIHRQTFNEVQDDVPGSPKYYAEVKGTYATGDVGSTHGYFHRVEQRMEDSNSLHDRLMTLSFYYKAKEVAGATVGISFLKSVDGVSETKKDIGEFKPTSIATWKRYSTTFMTPAGKTAANSNSYNAVALYTVDMARYGAGHTGFPGTLQLAQVKLEEGNGTMSYPEIDPQEELRNCERYYHTSYPVDKHPGNSTMISTISPNTNAIQFMVPQNGRYVHRFSESMRITPTSLAIWSPTGLTANAFNVTAGKDLTRTAGTSGLLGGRRTSVSNDPARISADTQLGAEIHIVAGFAPLDIIAFHYQADSEL
jgi:hypothetical protein